MIINRKIPHLFILVGIVALILFGVICYGVLTESSWIDYVDRKLIGIIQSNVTDTKTQLISILTEIGNIRLIIVLTIVIVTILFLKRDYVTGLSFGLTILLFVAIGTHIIKKKVDRTRPDFLPLIEKTTESFPSGHASSATVFYGLLALGLIFLVEKIWVKVVLGFTSFALISFVLMTRIYLGVHFPTDVIAGFFYGIATIFLSAGVFDYLYQPLRTILSKGITEREKE